MPHTSTVHIGGRCLLDQSSPRISCCEGSAGLPMACVTVLHPASASPFAPAFDRQKSGRLLAAV